MPALCIAGLSFSTQAIAQNPDVTQRLTAAVDPGTAKPAAPAARAAAPVKPRPQAQPTPPPPFIPAINAFNEDATTSKCSDGDIEDDHSLRRLNPEWKPINSLNLDLVPTQHFFTDQPTILEGFIVRKGSELTSNDQSDSEVSEEEIPWNHFTHDFTIKVTPDPIYQRLLSSWPRFHSSFPATDRNGISSCNALGGTINNGVCTVDDKCDDGSTTAEFCHHFDMEVEWENASLMDEGEGFQRIWGSVPEFVWPGGGDRVWVMGRWIFDCGHPFLPQGVSDKTFVKFGTEIHPVRALVTFRLNHLSLDTFPRPRVSAPNFLPPQSYLPVTGQPVILPPDVPNSGPTQVPVTEADVFISGNGGGANDLCMVRASTDDNDCKVPHTLSVVPVNDRNYVFDIYPPGTDFDHPDPVTNMMKVTPPTADSSLQWRVIPHDSELPSHTCGGLKADNCVTLQPIFCLIDESIPPPTQNETGCPNLPPSARPTRLRVILPFAGSPANYFAQSILVGWDDVPVNGSINFPVRNLKVTLHQLQVLQNSTFSGPFSGNFPGNWRVFVNVGGQYRYISQVFDRNDDGSNKCNGNVLTAVFNGDCFFFDDTPWFVTVQNFTPVHVGVGGFEHAGIDDDFCRKFLTPDNIDNADKCEPFGPDDVAEIIGDNSTRIGDYEFDLTQAHNYQWTDPEGNPITSHTTQLNSFDAQYMVQFRVDEIPAPTPPVSDPIQVGSPSFGKFISSATPVTLSSSSPDAEGFQYRSYQLGGPLPVYPFSPPVAFPVHWTHVDLPAGSQSVPVFLTGTDGENLLQFSTQSFANLLEPRHTEHLFLDNTPPVISIVQPQATTYAHSATLTLNYSADDGAGSGVASISPTMDGATSLPGGVGLQSGQQIRLLKELLLGSHTFTVAATDNVNNTGTASVTFTIVVTPASIIDDVTQFVNDGSIDNHGIANSLTVKLQHAADARAGGDCSGAANLYGAFINEVEAQSGKHVSADAAAILIADAQFLIANCP